MYDTHRSTTVGRGSLRLVAALPADETERIPALSGYDVAGSGSSESLNRLARIGGLAFGAPLSGVTMINECGGSARLSALAAYAMRQDEPLVVCDVYRDARFSDHLRAAESADIRFYAGAVLRTDEGDVLGCLWVADRMPRDAPTPAQVTMLRDLAAQAVEVLETANVSAGLQRKLEFALEARKMGCFEWDPETNQVHWSRRLFEIMGFPVAPCAPSPKELLRCVHPEDRSALLKEVREGQRSGQRFRLKYRWLHGSRGERSVTSIAQSIHNGSRQRAALVGVAWDSSEQDENVRALAESEELFRTLSSACPMGIFRTDINENTTYVNPRLMEIWDLPPDELVGWKWKSRLHPEDAGKLAHVDLATFTPGTHIQREYRLVMPDGAIRWIQSRAAVVSDGNGKPSGKVGTVDDITERKTTLLELQAAKEAAEIASRSKDLFLANVSHELRTPLNGVLGMTDLLLETELSADQREMAEIVRDSGRSLLMVVNDLLDLNRIEAGKLVIQHEPFDWNAMLRQVITLLEPEAKRKGLLLELKQSANVATRFVGDAGRVKQILLVYLTNALKFTAMGSVTVDVVADTISSEASEILLTVRDTGPGISVEEQAKLFRPFSQVDPTSTRKHGGVGLGLAIARSLAELMGGSVGVVSAPGEGSTFWLRLVLPTYNGTESPAAEEWARC